jgi:hypothetical protein
MCPNVPIVVKKILIIDTSEGYKTNYNKGISSDFSRTAIFLLPRCNSG